MAGKYWTTEPEVELPIRIGESGYAAAPAKTFIDVLKESVKKHGDRNALGQKKKVGDQPIPEEWTFWTYKQYYADCMRFAKVLHHFNVDNHKIVNILGFNAPEWLIANTGAILAGCIATGIYATNTPEACHYITQHSKAEILVVEDNNQLKKYANPKVPMPELKAIVLYHEKPDPKLVETVPFPTFYWPDFLDIGNNVLDEDIEKRHSNIRPGHCASLIYTSGTTGPPKAVMISHDNIVWTATNICIHYMNLSHEDRVVSYLPLSHIAAQLIDIYCMGVLGACTYFCQPDALKGTLTVTMKDVLPTFFFAVPRVWEKMAEKIQQIGREMPAGLKKNISTWAKGKATAYQKRQQFGEDGSQPWGYGCAKPLLNSIKDLLGLAKCQGCFTAAAPIAPETLWYFASLDIPIYEVFGQSECTGPHTVSDKGKWKIGTCGRPIKGSTTWLDPSTGELCYGGRHIFMGYMYMPEKTAETIDDKGLLHSGDVAVLDEHNDPDIPEPSGFLSITGRIKELIITAGGENVPPVLIENEMKAAMPPVSNCMVIGDKRKFLSMLISIRVEVNPDLQIPTDDLNPDSLFIGKQIGSEAKTYTEAKKCPKWKEYINEGVKAANKKTTSNAQIVQKWEWLPVDFSEKEGDLTPTLKLKRSVVAGKYAELIDGIYS